MKKGIRTLAASNYGDEKYLKLKEFGFECVDFPLVNTETPYYQESAEVAEGMLLKEKELASQAGIEIFQVHGPWRYPPRDETSEDRAERMEKMKKSIYYTALLGCKNWVVHPVMPFGMQDKETGKEEETRQMNLAFMRELLVTAKEYDVTICLENLPFRQFSLATPADILGVVKEIDDDHFKMCLDTGHTSVFEGLTPGNAARECGDAIRVLHVHDNDGSRDLHWLPFVGKTDWKDFCGALREIGFEGAFSYETEPNPQIPAPIRDEVLKLMARQIDLLAREG